MSCVASLLAEPFHRLTSFSHIPLRFLLRFLLPFFAPFLSDMARLPPSFAGELTIEHPKIDTIATCILFSAVSIRRGRPSLEVELPNEWLTEYKSPEPDDQDGLIATYLAECDRVGIPQRIPVIDYFMTCFQIEDNMFDCRAALAFLDNKESARDVLAVASTLKYFTWFTSFVCVDFPLKNEGASALASMFDVSTSFRKLVLVNAKITKPAMNALASRLALGLQEFEYLSICNNQLSDAGIIALTEGLKTSKRVPSTLSLSNTDMGNKGVLALAKLLATPAWAAGLQVLDISENSLGKAGTDALASWLIQPTVRLEQLLLRKSEVDLERLFPALAQNQTLINSTLALLDVSGNKFTKKTTPELCAILATSRSLSCFVLADCHIEVKYLLDIIDTCVQNETGVHFSLDVSKNDFGPKGAVQLQTLLADRVAKDAAPLTQRGVLQHMNFSETNLGNEGLATIAKAFTGLAIRVLKLDKNFKQGLFGKALEAADALADFVAGTPTLCEFSIAGDDNNYYLGKYLLPMLSATAHHPSLSQLSVQGNRIGDEGVQLVADLLSTSKTIRGFNIEGSRMTLTGLVVLHRSVKLSRTVTDMEIPVQDLERIIKTVPADRVREVQAVVHDLDMTMDRNDQILRYQASLEEEDEDDVMINNANHLGSSGANASTSASTVSASPSASSTSCASTTEGGFGAGSSESKTSDGLTITPASSSSSSSPAKAVSSSSSATGLMPGATGSGRSKRMSIAADSYENMIASLKDTKTHRKMITRGLDSSVLMMAAPEGSAANANVINDAS